MNNIKTILLLLCLGGFVGQVQASSDSKDRKDIKNTQETKELKSKAGLQHSSKIYDETYPYHQLPQSVWKLIEKYSIDLEEYSKAYTWADDSRVACIAEKIFTVTEDSREDYSPYYLLDPHTLVSRGRHGFVELYDLMTGTLLFSIPDTDLYSYDSPEQFKLTSGHVLTYHELQTIAKIWDRNGKQCAELQVDERDNHRMSRINKIFELSPGKLAVQSGDDGRITIFEVSLASKNQNEKPKIIKDFSLESDRYCSSMLLLRNRKLATGWDDGSLVIWDLDQKEGKEKVAVLVDPKFRFDGSIHDLAEPVEGYLIARSTRDENHIQFWDIRTLQDPRCISIEEKDIVHYADSGIFSSQCFPFIALPDSHEVCMVQQQSLLMIDLEALFSGKRQTVSIDIPTKNAAVISKVLMYKDLLYIVDGHNHLFIFDTKLRKCIDTFSLHSNNGWTIDHQGNVIAWCNREYNFQLKSRRIICSTYSPAESQRFKDLPLDDFLICAKICEFVNPIRSTNGYSPVTLTGEMLDLYQSLHPLMQQLLREHVKVS